MDIFCKKCGVKQYTKNSFVRGVQRYRCKQCGCNFIQKNSRQKVALEGKALAVLLYASGKSSYGFIARLFKCLTYRCAKMDKGICPANPGTILYIRDQRE